MLIQFNSETDAHNAQFGIGEYEMTMKARDDLREEYGEHVFEVTHGVRRMLYDQGRRFTVLEQ